MYPFLMADLHEWCDTFWRKVLLHWYLRHWDVLDRAFEISLILCYKRIQDKNIRVRLNIALKIRLKFVNNFSYKRWLRNPSCSDWIWESIRRSSNWKCIKRILFLISSRDLPKPSPGRIFLKIKSKVDSKISSLKFSISKIYLQE